MSAAFGPGIVLAQFGTIGTGALGLSLAGAPSGLQLPGSELNRNLFGFERSGLITGLQLGETYTDNVNLVPPGQESSDFITQINPILGARYRSRRFLLNLNYRMQNLIFAENPEFNRTNHQLEGDANAELIRRWLFVDLRTSAGQSIISSDRPVPTNTVTGAANQTNVYTVSVSPYIAHDFETLGRARLRYTFDRVFVEKGASDSQSNRIDADIESDPTRGRLAWKGNFHKQRIETLSDNSSDSSIIQGADNFEEALAEARYRLTRSLSALAHVGYANNEFNTTQTNIRNGAFASIGAAWEPTRSLLLEATAGPRNKDAAITLRPNERNTLHVTYRDRDVGLNPGPAWNGTLTHRARQSVWEATYLEDTTTVQEVFASQQLANVVNPQTGALVLEPNGQPVVQTLNVFTLTNDVIVRKVFQGSVGLATGKTGIRLDGFHEQRQQQISGIEEQGSGGTASWSWRFAPRTLSFLNGSWQTVTQSPDDQKTSLWYIQAGLSKSLYSKFLGSISYQYTASHSDTRQNEYNENRLTLLITMSF